MPESGVLGVGGSRQLTRLSKLILSLSVQLWKFAGLRHSAVVHRSVGALARIGGAAFAGVGAPNRVATAATSTAATNDHTLSRRPDITRPPDPRRRACRPSRRPPGSRPVWPAPGRRPAWCPGR